MIRHPREPKLLELDGDQEGSQWAAEGGVSVTPVPKDLLWKVCMPHLNQMMETLQQTVQQEIQMQVEQATAKLRQPAQERPGEVTRRAVLQSPHMPERGNVRNIPAFNSLLGIGRPMSPEPVQEEEEPTSVCPETDSPCPSSTAQTQSLAGGSEADAPIGGPRKFPQKVVSPGYTATGPTMPGGTHVPSGGGKGDGVGPNGQSVPTGNGYEGKGPGADAAKAASASSHQRPMFLVREQPHTQSGWKDKRCTPTISPLVPTTEPTWSSPVPPNTEPSMGNFYDVGPHAEPSVATMGSADSTEGADKSAMVCRHWKTKGWCKLVDKCKFLHPENKRGSGSVPQRKPTGGGAADDDDTPEAANGGTTGARRSRRAGRSRRGAGGSGPATAAAASQPGGGAVPASGAMAPGPVAAGSAAQTSMIQ